LNEAHGRDWSLYHGDTVEIARQMPGGCVDLAIFSPPFANLYTYSDSERDMGNAADDREFFVHYRYLAEEITRLLRPGRICLVHCKDLVDYKGRDGRAGLRDFPGELIRVHEEAGLKFHSRVTIWKCPVTEMQRTKAHGLLWKTLRSDATFSRQGMAEYLLGLRKWADEDDPNVVPVTNTKEGFPVEQWQEWASPVWMDINQTRTLNVEMAREDKDEKHMCPLQLDVIERGVRLWSNPGETVYSPFAGIASEGVGTLGAGRKFWGAELKESYWRNGVENLRQAEGAQQLGLFGQFAG
jgi:DNA modification methylase